ncbi:hypothetical protein FOCC_FOCC008636 [Frankliniella occidentalis]|nr:hypothetical protein FOCC_FOCC008636 [Frankliniella occidentalis]
MESHEYEKNHSSDVSHKSDYCSQTGHLVSDDEDILNCSDTVVCNLDENNENRADEDDVDEFISPRESSEEESDDGDSDDPDEPDDPDDPDPDRDPPADNLGLGNGDVVEADNRPFFSFENPRLNRVLQLGFDCTVREAVAMIAALAVRYNMEYDLLVKMFRVSNIMLGEAQLPSTKDQLWSILNRQSSVSRRHAYCSVCNRELGLYDTLERIVACQCGSIKPRKKIKYFITLSLTQQLKRCLELPGMWEKLQYREERRIINEGAWEDICDGDRYIQLSMRDGGLQEPYDFTYNFNLDGFKMTKSSNREGTPIFIRLNEAHPNYRQQFVFLAGLWVDDSPPILHLFLNRFIGECNVLSTVGVAWNQPGGQNVVSKFFPAACCVDAVERAKLMCHSPHSGPFACPFCNQEGVHINARKFPLPGTEFDIMRRRQNQDYAVHVVVPQAELRTDATTRRAMEQVENAQQVGQELNIEGVVGSSELKNLTFFDLVDSLSSDDLHPIYLGCAAFHMKLILRRLNPHEINAISGRLRAIKCPTNISRKPRNIGKKKSLKGSEWEHILLYFGVPCMQGIVQPEKITLFGLLSSAIYILSRDSITEQNFQTADRLIRLYMIRFQNTYGPINMRFNIHMLSHLVKVCRSWGPLFVHSTAPFESYNCILGKKVTSPKAAADQIVQRYFLKSLIAEVPGSPDISPVVKEEVAFIMQKDVSRPTVVVGSSKLYGRVTARETTVEERQALMDEGLDAIQLQEFVKMKYNFFEFRSINYNPNEDIRSDNSLIYTFQNFFGRILSIVSIGEGDNKIVGLFVERYNVGERLSGVHHIVQLLDRADIHFIRPHDVRNLAIKVIIGNVSFIMAMANNSEID